MIQCAMSDIVFLDLCLRGTAEEVRKALDSGANIHVRDKIGATALMYAAEENPSPEVVKVLLILPVVEGHSVK